MRPRVGSNLPTFLQIPYLYASASRQKLARCAAALSDGRSPRPETFTGGYSPAVGDLHLGPERIKLYVPADHPPLLWRKKNKPDFYDDSSGKCPKPPTPIRTRRWA